MGTPTIDKAIKHIALDNGIINRHEPPIEELVKRINLLLSASYTADVLGAVEAELATYTDAELEDICIGGSDDRRMVSALAEQILDEIFEDL